MNPWIIIRFKWDPDQDRKREVYVLQKNRPKSCKLKKEQFSPATQKPKTQCFAKSSRMGKKHLFVSRVPPGPALYNPIILLPFSLSSFSFFLSLLPSERERERREFSSGVPWLTQSHKWLQVDKHFSSFPTTCFSLTCNNQIAPAKN